MATKKSRIEEIESTDAYLTALKNDVYHGGLLLHILSFIEWDAQTISSHQQTFRGNREWKSAELLKLKEKWLKERWEMIEKIVGKDTTKEMKECVRHARDTRLNEEPDGTVVFYDTDVLGLGCVEQHARTRLNFFNDKIANEGCRVLAPALEQMTALKELYFYANEIGDKGCEYLAPALSQMTALEKLSFNNNDIDDKGCEYLAPALSQMTALKILSLSSNDIGKKGCEHLAPVLKQMTALETLDLEINQIGDKGCEYLAPVLKQMTALEVLNLHYNKIGDKGCEALAPVLKQMTALKELTLWSNQIGDEGKVLIKSVFSGYDVKF